MITPRTLSGFKDRLPKEASAKAQMLKKITASFEKFGFTPIETPHLEYAEILVKQGSDEIQKELYRFSDHGGRDVALRFDLTVPLARFISQYRSELGLPFKRYCIGNVFRGERAQKGRYREFTQCDFDFIGTTSFGAEVEILQVIWQALSDLGLRDFTIHINNRKIFNALMASFNALPDTVETLRIVDKIDKIGSDAVASELKLKTSLNEAQITQLLGFIALKQNDNDSVAFLDSLLEKYGDLGEQMHAAITELHDVCKLLGELIPVSNFAINLSIARGLGYYTGIVFETTLNAASSLGSVCSGGRYDNLTQNFSSEKMSGVGASIGLDRLLAGLEDLGLLSASASANALIIALESLPYAYFIAKALRDMGAKIEVYPDITKPQKSFKYANNRGYKYVVVLGESEQASNTLTLKNMESGEQRSGLSLEEVAGVICTSV